MNEDQYLDNLEGFLKRLKKLGWRGLALVHSSDVASLASSVSELLSRLGSCLALATAAYRGWVRGCEAAGPPDLERILGREYDYALVAVEGLLRPNILAGIAEVVRGGGALVVTAPPIDEWNPGPPEGTGLYKEYLLRSLESLGSLYWTDADTGRVYAERLPGSPAGPKDRGPGGFKSRIGVPRSLIGLAATRDQAAALEAFASFLRGRARSLAVLGDRGRGKSYLLGLGLALAIHWHAAGRVEVVAPSRVQAWSLMEGLLRGLDSLGYQGRYRAWREEGIPYKVTGPWFRVAVSTPENAEPAPLLVVDEAAAVGVARVRRLSWRSGKVVIATTLHGYEGSGRAVAHLLLRDLPRPLSVVELREPIRYPAGDPLEAWVYDTFLLNVEPPEGAPKVDASAVGCAEVDRRRLARDPRVLRRIARILATAHYRNEPDDILVMLEAPNHRIFQLEAGGEPVAVADVALEDPDAPEEARLGLRALEAHAGSLASGLKSVRVVRIAVSPPLQRRGLGSRLLHCIEEWARSQGADVVTTIFSRHEVIGFWARNGYKAVYMSPRYNRATGEKNIAFAKPLTPRGRVAVEEASRAFRLRLLISGHSIYRDVAAERIPTLIEATTPTDAPLALTEEQEKRLKAFLDGQLDYEQAHDAVYIAVTRLLARQNPTELGLDPQEAAAIVARVVQGKPLNDVASIIGKNIEEAHKLVVYALRRVLS